MMQKNDCLVSLVTITDNDGASIESFLRAASALLQEHYADYEILLIDQSSKDDTLAKLRSLFSKIPSARVLELSQPVGRDVAWAAGLENAIGDVVVLLDMRNDPLDIVPKAVDQYLQGNDVVVGLAKHRQTLFYRLSRPCARWALRKFVHYSLPADATEFRCLSRQAANAVTRTGRFRHSFFIRIAQTGYIPSMFRYHLKNATRRRTFQEGLTKTLKMLVYNSSRPLRWVSILGCAGSLTALVFSGYSLLINFIKNDVAEGWTTLVVFISILFFLLFIVLSIFGEYLGRMLDSIKTPYEYDVLFESNSSVMQDLERYNVTEHTTQSILEPSTEEYIQEHAASTVL